MKTGAIYLGNNRTHFIVWAPAIEYIQLHLVHPGQRLDMKKNAEGFFELETTASPGTEYFYQLPDGKDLPDPASQFQPEGVHGPSAIVDHESFTWSDTAWKGIPFRELLLCEIHVGTYTPEGNFEALIGKLPYLKETGINAIELMPVGQFPGTRNWGYDGAYPYAVQNSYGGPEGLKKLVNACHAEGIAVFLDVVYNHFGPEGTYVEKFAPYFTDRYKNIWGKAINLDGPWSDPVREYFSDNAIYWLNEFHIDGIRFDAIHGMFDAGAHPFWNLMHEKIQRTEQRLGRKLHTVAESDLNDPKVIASPAVGGFGFTAQWLDDFHHALFSLIDRETGKKKYADFGSPAQLAKAFKEGFVHSGEYVQFRKRKYGASSAGIDGDHFIAFIENHDQAGNSAKGERMVAILGHRKIKLLAAALLLSPYVPMLFMGEEYGEDAPFLYFGNHSDPELIEAVRTGRKNEFEHMSWDGEPADPFDPDTFHRSKLQWEKLDNPENREIWYWYQALIALRKKHPALQNFSKDDLLVNRIDRLLIIFRRAETGNDSLLILFNFSEGPADYIPDNDFPEARRIIDSARSVQPAPVHTEQGPAPINRGEKISLDPYAVQVYDLNP